MFWKRKKKDETRCYCKRCGGKGIAPTYEIDMDKEQREAWKLHVDTVYVDYLEARMSQRGRTDT